MGSVPVATIENANRGFVNGWQGSKEADEAALIVNL